MSETKKKCDKKYKKDKFKGMMFPIEVFFLELWLFHFILTLEKLKEI